jgi:hypothetical protein
MRKPGHPIQKRYFQQLLWGNGSASAKKVIKKVSHIVNVKGVKSLLEKVYGNVCALLALILINFYPNTIQAQNYQALQGSNFAGALAVYNNPAAIVQSPFKWEITPLGIQGKVSTNFLYTIRKDMFSFPLNYKYNFEEGEKKRYAHTNTNLNLINTRLSFGRNRAIAFGSNIRVYANGTTSKLRFRNEAIDDVNGIITSNLSNQPISAKVVANAMWEGYFTYAQILVEDPRYRLNGGATLKFSRGISGVAANLDLARFSPMTSAADASYFYSSNFDKWESGGNLISNLYKFGYFTQGGSNMDLGLEFLIKTQAATTFYDDDDFYDYRWKFSLALMDLGYNKFRYGLQSRYLNKTEPDLTYSRLQEKINYKIKGIEQFNDSIATITELRQFGQKFNIINPTRMVISADYFMNRSFFINTELSLNMGSWLTKKWDYVTDISFITVTPRWDSEKWGISVPISLTDQMRFWIGGAIKVGPLVIGIHNLKYLYSARSMQNGGGYVALMLRSPQRNLPKKEKWMALLK